MFACLYAASLSCSGGAERSTPLSEALSALLATGLAAPAAIRWGWNASGWVRTQGWQEGFAVINEVGKDSFYKM